jgi:hypothetical protein
MPLRELFAFWLTPDAPQSPRTANMWRNRTLSGCVVRRRTCPEYSGQRELGSTFSDSL